MWGSEWVGNGLRVEIDKTGRKDVNGVIYETLNVNHIYNQDDYIAGT